MAEVKKVEKTFIATERGHDGNRIINEGEQFTLEVDPKQMPSWAEEVKPESKAQPAARKASE